MIGPDRYHAEAQSAIWLRPIPYIREPASRGGARWRESPRQRGVTGRMCRRERWRGASERIPIEWIAIRSTSLALAHVLIGKPISTFPEHASDRGRARTGAAAALVRARRRGPPHCRGSA